tara:strand:- start:188 stop:613 length:426 start_codon:yes stop_codon:yes gene_type:complete
MKKIFLLLFTFFSFSYFFGQGNNLQFSQVINQDFIITPSSSWTWTNAGTIVVPANKVLKITSCSSYKNGNSTSRDAYPSNMRIGSKLVYGTQIGANSTGVAWNISMPIWLATGTYSVELMSSSAGNQINGSISGVEFNIVQ